MGILELLDGVLRKPANTFNMIAREKPVVWALIIFAVSTVFSLISTDYSELESLQINVPSPVILLVIFLAGWFIFTALLHLLSRLFKGSGDYWGLFSAFGFAQFPGFLTPIAAILRNIGGIAGAVLGGIISAAAAVWVLVLSVIALRESGRITTGASILTYLITLIIIIAVALVGVFSLIAKMRMVM